MYNKDLCGGKSAATKNMCRVVSLLSACIITNRQVSRQMFLEDAFKSIRQTTYFFLFCRLDLINRYQREAKIGKPAWSFHKLHIMWGGCLMQVFVEVISQEISATWHRQQRITMLELSRQQLFPTAFLCLHIQDVQGDTLRMCYTIMWRSGVQLQ